MDTGDLAIQPERQLELTTRGNRASLAVVISAAALIATLTKVGSMAGAATFAWRIFDTWDAHRGRLAIRTRSRDGRGLILEATYRAKSEHEGVNMTFNVLSPPEAVVAGFSGSTPEITGVDSAVALILAREDAARSSTTAAVRRDDSPSGTFHAEGEVFANSSSVEKAVVRVVVRGSASNRRFASQTFKVSAAD